MEFVILDLEWNGTYSRRLKGFINEIIEFGAVKVDENLNIISTFSHLVRPQIGKKISGKIKSLTNLTNEQLSHGMHFMQVVSRFRKWMGNAVLLTWGSADILTLIENCKYFCGNGKIPFLRRYMNLQAYCADRVYGDDSKLMGLSSLAEQLGIDQDDIEHHRALDDSLLSLRCFRRLYDKEAVLARIEKADKQFYEKITFKTVIVCDLSNPQIKRKDLLFYCDCCGRQAHRETDWVLKNKSYRANFFCRNCHNRFYGKLQFKLKYDGLVVRKNILPYEDLSSPPKEDRREKKEVNVVRVNKCNK
ncbi:MAG: exonuclease domain-containing protein [Oscillospiraceae bacterium]|nr:exonuclease domain-containing protein [Oscillospiraceae bacterium]